MFKSSFAIFFFFVINLISGFILQSLISVWWHATFDDLVRWLASVEDHVDRWLEKNYPLLRLVCICFRIEKSDFFFPGEKCHTAFCQERNWKAKSMLWYGFFTSITISERISCTERLDLKLFEFFGPASIQA